jgi:hypothetical protein
VTTIVASDPDRVPMTLAGEHHAHLPSAIDSDPTSEAQRRHSAGCRPQPK